MIVTLAFMVPIIMGNIDKVVKTIDIFKDIVSPLKRNFGFAFGYMIIFDDGCYYPLVDDIKFLTNFTSNAKESSIFCQEDITSSSDEGYRFTLWPDNPLNKTMQICYDHGMWNGITVSLIKKNFIELWWFTGDGSNARDFFTRNKDFLIKFIHYFNHYKKKLLIDENLNLKKRDLFKFENGFDINISNSELENEKEKIRTFLNIMKSKSFTLSTECGEATLSPREIQVLSHIASGLTAKLAATQMNITTRTARHYIENIKIKTHLHQKINLIKLYLDNFKGFFE